MTLNNYIEKQILILLLESKLQKGKKKQYKLLEAQEYINLILDHFNNKNLQKRISKYISILESIVDEELPPPSERYKSASKYMKSAIDQEEIDQDYNWMPYFYTEDTDNNYDAHGNYEMSPLPVNNPVRSYSQHISSEDVISDDEDFIDDTNDKLNDEFIHNMIDDELDEDFGSDFLDGVNEYQDDAHTVMDSQQIVINRKYKPEHQFDVNYAGGSEDIYVNTNLLDDDKPITKQQKENVLFLEPDNELTTNSPEGIILP